MNQHASTADSCSDPIGCTVTAQGLTGLLEPGGPSPPGSRSTDAGQVYAPPRAIHVPHVPFALAYIAVIQILVRSVRSSAAVEKSPQRCGP